MSPSGRYTALVIHGDGGVLDVLTRWFEASGFDVITATSAFRAQAHLEGERPVEVGDRGLGRHHIRSAARCTAGYSRTGPTSAPGSCSSPTTCRPSSTPSSAGAASRSRSPLSEELVRVAKGVVQPRPHAAARRPDRARPEPARACCSPTTIRSLLAAMADLFTQQGYAVSQVESGDERHRAGSSSATSTSIVARLADARWQRRRRLQVDPQEQAAPRRARVVFLSEADQDDSGPVAPGRPMFRKGQDSQGLVEVLKDIVATSKRARERRVRRWTARQSRPAGGTRSSASSSVEASRISRIAAQVIGDLVARSGSLSCGHDQRRIPLRRAASTFSLMPPIGRTPDSVISPVIATCGRIGRLGEQRDERA